MKLNLLCLLMLSYSHVLFAGAGTLPYDYESPGGHMSAENNGGSLSKTSLGAVRGNPAMLAVEKKYEIDASYMWPSEGREVFQAGVVDSITSVIALGILYTGHREEYEYWGPLKDTEKEKAFTKSAATRRIAVGAAFNFSGLSLGLGGQFVEGTLMETGKGISGMTLGGGGTFTLLDVIRLGGSIENLLNESVKEFAPRIYRAGVNYKPLNSLSLSLDYTHRDRVPQEQGFAIYQNPTSSDLFTQQEMMLTVSSSFTLAEMFTVSAGYGRSFDKTERQSLGGGVSFNSNGFLVSYTLRRPYFSQELYNHVVHASYHIRM